MNDNTKLPDHYFAPGTLAQQEINRLTVAAHMMASTLASTSASLTEAQARNVQLAAALELVQGECGMLMGKVAKWEARDSGRAPSIDAIALAVATSITSACFAGVPGAKLTERAKELVAEAMRAGGAVFAPAAPIDRDTAELCLWRLAEGDGHEIRFNAPLKSDERTWVAYCAANSAAPRAVPLPAGQKPLAYISYDAMAMLKGGRDISLAASTRYMSHVGDCAIYAAPLPLPAGLSDDDTPISMSTYGTKEACEAEHARRSARPAGLSEQPAAPSVKQLSAQLHDGHTWKIAEQKAFAQVLAAFPNESSQGIISLGDAWKRGQAYGESMAVAAAKLTCREAATKLRTYAAIYTGDKQARRLANELENIATPSAKPAEGM